MIESELLKYRSYASCISSAYNLMCNHFKIIFRETWLAVLLFSLLSTVCWVLTRCLSENTDLTQLIIKLVFLLNACLDTVVVGSWLMGELVTLQNGQEKRKNFTRSLKLQCSYLIILLIAFFLTAGLWMLLSARGVLFSTFVAFAVAIACYIVLLPCSYSAAKYLFDPSSKLKTIMLRDYCEGWRHWGFLFVVNFIAFIILFMAFMVVQAPTLLMQIADGVNEYGMALGDTTGLPSYFTFLLCVIMIITQFIGAYVAIWYFWVLAYVYGTIEEKKRARTLAEKNIIMQ